MGDVRPILQAWWRDRVDYRWVVATFRARSALAPMKIMVGSGGLVMVVITVLALVSHAGQSGTLGVTQAIIAATLAGLWTLRWWLLPWPSAAESLVWVAVVDLAVTANNVMVQDRLLGALGIVLLVTTGGYVTIFHGLRILAVHIGWSVLSIVLVATLLVIGWPGENPHATGDLALGVGVAFANIAVACVVLPIVQFSHWLLRLDALSDPLTMLLNRRGLDVHLANLASSTADRAVYVVLFDLDRFKSVNDNIGHAFGDEVLVRTARCLRAAGPPGAVAARTGGDEFVVVGWLADGAVGAVAERLRDAIETMAGLPITITASVGVAVADPVRDADPRTGSIYRSLFRRADSAMYRAKQLGGNAVVVAESAPGYVTTVQKSE
ncbi:diguanylate cyclase domain-containing protein [Nocardia sp. CA-128927]|uniref:GGDEF domain-containing protein n=1 Tax=Nocardia sp. CA-128927 TaxID=3239975 RepID=UPI003D97AE05